MARPTTKRRLRDIDPDNFTCDDIVKHVKKRVSDLFPLLEEDVVDHHIHGVTTSVALLARFARGGDSLSNLKRITSALLSVRAWFERGACEDIDIVLLAAHARVRLACGDALSARELACLAGVDPDHVRLLARRGEITIERGVVPSAMAQQWLEARSSPSRRT